MMESSVCRRSSHINSGDLIVEILLRLPPNSVHPFRRVCKQWYSLISNPDFLRTHAITEHHDHQLLVPISKLRPSKGLVYFVHVPYDDVQYDEEDRKPDPLFVRLQLFPRNTLTNYELIDSSNGLLLFCGDDSNGSTNYYVTNPSTKCYFKLPNMIPIPKEEKVALKLLNSPRHATTLVFDPSISLSYKVIRYLIPGSRSNNNDLQIQIYIYSSKTRSWRVLSAIIPHSMSTFFSWLISVVLNGVLYLSSNMTEGDDLFCFDVEKECVWFLPLPPKPETSSDCIRYCLYFGECGGRLRLIERFVGGGDYYTNCLPCSFDVMETEPQQKQQQQQPNSPQYTWTVKYRVNIGRVCKRSPSIIHCYKTKNRQGESEEEEEVLLLKLKYERAIVSFSLTSNKFKNDELITIPEKIDLCDSGDNFAYKPTLFPVS